MKKIIYVFLALLVSGFYCMSFASTQSDYMTGRDAFYKHEYQAALRYFNNAILKDDQYVDAYCGKGEVEIELKKFDDAIKSYTKALEIDENNIDALIGRAAAYGLKPKPNFKLAYIDLNKAIEIDSDNIEAHVARAIVNYSLKDKKSAYKDINYVLELEPNNPEAYAIKSMFEFSDLKFVDAMKNFGKYSELNKAKEDVKQPVVPKFEQGFDETL